MTVPHGRGTFGTDGQQVSFNGTWETADRHGEFKESNNAAGMFFGRFVRDRAHGRWLGERREYVFERGACLNTTSISEDCARCYRALLHKWEN